MKALFARKDLRLLFGGQTVSMFGDWMMIIVLGIWAKTLTGSSSQAGLVFLVLGVTGLVAPLGGLVVDRLPKRPLMIATQLSLAGVMCLLLFVHDRGDTWILYSVTLLYGLGGDLFAASRGAMLKAMVDDELLAEANGAYQSIREGLRIVAPLAGAGIFAAWGGSVVAMVDAGTFVVSAAALAALQFIEPARAVKEHHFLKEISA
jgi:MFS family permease